MSLSLAFLTFAICAIAAPAITPASFRLWRFSDLKARGLVNSRAQLKLMVELYGFPPGKMLTPNARVWVADEVDCVLRVPNERVERRQLSASQ